MPRIEPTARIANGGAIRAAASISIAPAPNISASRSETCSAHSPEAHSDQLRPSEDLFPFSYIAVLRSVALDRSTPWSPKSARCAAEVELPAGLSNRAAFGGFASYATRQAHLRPAPLCPHRL